MTRHAVILTHNRPVELARTVEQIAPQCDRVLIVDNASTPPVRDDGWPGHVHVRRDGTQPPNLAALWNRALDTIASGEAGRPAWEVALLCDDLDIPPDWYDRVAAALRAHGVTAASTHQYTPISAPIVKTAPDGDIYTRMCGSAFVLAGERGLRADESMHWWWVDTDVDTQARLNGGIVLAPGPITVNTIPNGWTNAKPELAERAGRDRAAYILKWGSAPW